MQTINHLYRCIDSSFIIKVSFVDKIRTKFTSSQPENNKNTINIPCFVCETNIENTRKQIINHNLDNIRSICLCKNCLNTSKTDKLTLIIHLNNVISNITF